MFSFSKILGKGTTNTEVRDVPSAEDALPASWYSSPAMYELERRSIFSRKWILVSHSKRFSKAGDFVRIMVAGTDLFLIKTRNDKIRAFHNVCRHRAYPLVQTASGSLSILSCKYHGWSYGLDGRLAKAPRYQDVGDFDTGKLSLFPINVHIDKLDFVWINLEAGDQPRTAWEDDFGGVDEQPRLQAFDFSSYNFDHQWEMTGDYNWKTLADNYNECYHCPTGHPGVAAVSDLSKYWVETNGGHIIHWNVDKAEAPEKGIFSTFYYPNASMTVTPHFMYLMRCIPTSSSQTQMEYEVYRHKDATDEEFSSISDFFKQVLKEDKDLCNAAQRNLDAGIFLAGKLHPQCEQGPLYFQKMTREAVMSHRREEQRLGQQIWPAQPARVMSTRQQEEVEFCKALECEHADKTNDELQW